MLQAVVRPFINGVSDLDSLLAKIEEAGNRRTTLSDRDENVNV
jgi:hypothetical protein